MHNKQISWSHLCGEQTQKVSTPLDATLKVTPPPRSLARSLSLPTFNNWWIDCPPCMPSCMHSIQCSPQMTMKRSFGAWAVTCTCFLLIRHQDFCCCMCGVCATNNNDNNNKTKQISPLSSIGLKKPSSGSSSRTRALISVEAARLSKQVRQIEKQGCLEIFFFFFLMQKIFFWPGWWKMFKNSMKHP